jgi:hypothetical protein
MQFLYNTSITKVLVFPQCCINPSRVGVRHCSLSVPQRQSDFQFHKFHSWTEIYSHSCCRQTHYCFHFSSTRGLYGIGNSGTSLGNSGKSLGNSGESLWIVLLILHQHWNQVSKHIYIDIKVLKGVLDDYTLKSFN